MHRDVDLERTPVFRHLDYEWSFYGLTPGDIPIIAVPGALFFNICMWFGVDQTWSLVAMAAGAIGLVVLKWRKPKGYVEQLVHLAFAPRRLSHKEPDQHLRQFPLPRRRQETK